MKFEVTSPNQILESFQIIYFPTENRFGEQKQQTDQIIDF
jgi:hypothetical protein